jgi:L,D-transpeptidase ErfK/SrfK
MERLISRYRLKCNVVLAMKKILKTSLLTSVALAALGASSHAAVNGEKAKTEKPGKVQEASAALKSSKGRFDDAYIGEMRTVTAKYEDTLVHIGRDYGVGFVEMRAANPNLDPWIPGAGARVVVPTMNLLPDAPHDGVVINLAEMRMYIYRAKDKAPLTYPIGIGRDGLRTPVGVTRVQRKKDRPTWTPTERMRKEDPTLPVSVPPGPDNPMGTHALYLGFENIAIHGTNKPYGIGRRVSSGCIRMFPEDITQVFDMLPVGTKVTVVDQPIKASWIDDKLYLEVHPTQEQAAIMEREGTVPDYQLSEKDLSYIMKVAGAGVDTLDWAEIRKVVKQRRGYPVEIATRKKVKTGEQASSVTGPQSEAVQEVPQTAAALTERKRLFRD